MSKLLIAGCGYVGSALAQRVSAEGHEVIGLRRHPEKLPDGVHGLAADLGDPATLTAIPEGITQVVYAASPDGRDEEAYERAYVRGVENLVRFLETRGDPVDRLVFVSSTGVYGQDDGGWVDETSPTEPSHGSGKRMLEGESVAAGAPWPSVVLRLSGIYGPGRTRLVEKVRRGEARLPADGPRWSNRIHRDDCAGAVAHLLTLDAPAPVYVGVDHEPVPLADVMRWLAEELQVPEPPSEAPGEDGLDDARRRRSNKRCSSERLRASGYVFQHPTFRDGYRAMLRT